MGKTKVKEDEEARKLELPTKILKKEMRPDLSLRWKPGGEGRSRSGVDLNKIRKQKCLQ